MQAPVFTTKEFPCTTLLSMGSGLTQMADFWDLINLTIPGMFCRGRLASLRNRGGVVGRRCVIGVGFGA